MNPDTLQLLEGFAHELRTPLSAIAGHSALLTLGVHGPLTEAQAKALSRIEENKKQMILMISEVLGYAEAAWGVTAQPDKTALRPIIAQEVGAHAGAAMEQGVQLKFNDRPAVGAAGADASGCDAAYIGEHAAHEIVAIMLQDALAHSDKSSDVQVRLDCMEDSLRVVVESSVEANVQEASELLFVPYARDAHGRSVYAPGQALALPRARALARSVGAEVRAVFDNSRRILQFDVRRS